MNMKGMPAKITLMYGDACATTSGAAPMALRMKSVPSTPRTDITIDSIVSSDITWPADFLASTSFPAPACWETSATPATPRPAATETNKKTRGHARLAAATASTLTLPSQYVSTRLYSIWNTFVSIMGQPRTNNVLTMGPCRIDFCMRSGTALCVLAILPHQCRLCLSMLTEAIRLESQNRAHLSV